MGTLGDEGEGECVELQKETERESPNRTGDHSRPAGAPFPFSGGSTAGKSWVDL